MFIKEKILSQVKKGVKQIFGEEPEQIFLTLSPDVKFGDFSIKCFLLAKQFKESPEKIAKLVAEKISSSGIIQKAEAVGPYLNVKIDNTFLFKEICSEIISKDDAFGNSSGNDKRVMVEYLSPNTNKPLHLGHVRSGALGMAISNLLQATGNSTIRANLVNDRGVHICKSILAWQKWANGATPESEGIKGDHFVGNWYVHYSKEAEKNVYLGEEIQEMLQKWENGDPETVKLWKKMNDWVYKGFSQTYEKLSLKFDVFYYESETYKLGKDIVAEGLKKNVFHKNKEGAIVYELPEDKFGKDVHDNPKKVTLLRTDNTSVYITQDLGTALLKKNQYNLEQSIYVVGSEQEYHFKCLFDILKALDYSWAKGCYHLSYGMVYLPEGKMKSREGKIVDADNLIKKMEQLAKEEILKRNPENKLSEKEINHRANKIGVGAIKFYLLRVNPSQDIYFNPEKSISFDGFTGPYCQYVYARAAGILSKAKELKIETEKVQGIDFSLLGSNKEELLLVQKLIQFPDEIRLATIEFNPSRLAKYVYETAKAFNQFYANWPVINTGNKELTKARLTLVKVTSVIFKKGLNLLGIESLEEM